VSQVISITQEEYLECIGFSLYAYLEDKIAKRDLMKGAERSFGEFLEHFIRGKLAENALKKYLMSSFGVESLTDVDLPIFIQGDYLPDLVAYKTTEKMWSIPRFWIEIKAVTAKQKWMLIPTTSISGGKRTQPRPFCAYVECLVNLPQDHVARLIKYFPKIKEKMSAQWIEKLSDLPNIEVSILGYALYQDIECILRRDNLNEIYGEGNYGYLERRKTFVDRETGKPYGDFNRDNCAIRLSKLRKEWDPFIKQIKSNNPLAPMETRNMSSLTTQMNLALNLLSEKGYTSWFSRELKGKAVQRQFLHFEGFIK